MTFTEFKANIADAAYEHGCSLQQAGWYVVWSLLRTLEQRVRNLESKS